MRSLSLLAIVACTAVVSAQQDVVSPAYHANFRGNAANDMPFGGGFTWTGTIRLQQVHSDLRGTARTIRSLSFRPHVNQAPIPAGTADIEILMGEGDRSAATSAFATNYTSTPTVVFSRKVVNLAARSGVSQPFVEPWDITFVLDVPFSYSGQNDLVWEMRTYARTGGSFASFFGSDYAVQSTGYTVPNQAQSYQFGDSCGPAVGLSAPIATLPTGTEMTFNPWILGSSGLPFGAMLIGITNPNQPVPANGCIQTLLSDGLTIVSGLVDRSGMFAQSWTVPWQNSFNSGEIYLQGVFFDARSRFLMTRARHILLPPGPSPTIQVHTVIGTPVNATTGLVPVTPQQVIVRFGG